MTVYKEYMKGLIACSEGKVCPTDVKTLQGKPLVERVRGIGHLLGIGDEQRPQQEQLVGARLQGEAREALIAAMAVRLSALDDSFSA